MLFILCALLLTVSALLAVTRQVGSEETSAPALVWKDAKSNRVLFASDDITSFDWDKQVFLLKLDAALDFLAWVPPHMYQARKLVLEDSNGTIYEAHWVSRASSMGFSGPIYSPLSPNPFFSIANGYPIRGNVVPEAKDPRFADRLRTGLENAGILHDIDLTYNYVGLRIQRTGHSWTECGEDLKVRVEFFENTFRPGRKARAHVFFAGGEKTRTQIDTIALDIRFVANWGRFRSDCRIEGIPRAVIANGLYVCQFNPWRPVEGSDRRVEAGTGAVALSVLLQKKDATNLTTVYRLDFGEVVVPVVVPIEGEQGAVADHNPRG